ncbi:MAG: TVP38/TMEM64 family protein [Bacilli bacterium]|nr:TVP38/TMEM64 family protein [Bacilli bacterium]
MEIIMANIQEILDNLDIFTGTVLSSLGIWGALLSCLLIVVESILPVLPLCVFVTLLFYTFGNIVGFLISWICTCIGCYISFTLFRSKIKDWFEKRLVNGKVKKQIERIMSYVENISLSGLAVLVAIPFTPAFAVNIAAGLSNMPKKKFIMGILIGKIFMVYFWGYIGTTLLESITHPIYLLRICLLLLLAYIISKVANKWFKLD